MESSEVPTQVPENRREEYLKEFIGGAISLAKQGNWKDTVSHLANKDAAEAVGLRYEEDSRTWILKRTPTPQEVEVLSDRIAYNSQFSRTEGGSIRTANVDALPPKLTGGITVEIPDPLWQEVALIHLEEWLHGLQFISGKSLAGSKNVEEDVTKYLKQQGVTLTPYFVRRHVGRL